MSTQTIIASIDQDTLVKKQLNLSRRFTLAIHDNPALLEEIPDGVTLVLLPDDDPAFAEANMEIGLGELRRGKNVYFRHVRLDELPD